MRIDALRGKSGGGDGGDGGDALVLTDPDSIYYYCNFASPGSAFAALILPKDAVSVLVVRDLEVGNLQPSDLEVEVRTYAEEDPMTLVVAALGSARRVGVDLASSRLSPLHYRALLESFEVFDVSALALAPRLVKSEAEIAHMRTAARCVARALEDVCIREGVTETALAGELAMHLGNAGSEWRAYPEFVSFGANGCVGHHAPDATRLRAGDVVFMEIGASHQRYHAARMHTVVLGAPPPWFADLERRIRRAVAEARALCVPGAVAGDIDAHMRRIVEAAECVPRMYRRSGYSIGIGASKDWADGAIRLHPGSTDELQERMVLHIIPWVVVPQGAVGFSDVVVVRAGGGESVF